MFNDQKPFSTLFKNIALTLAIYLAGCSAPPQHDASSGPGRASDVSAKPSSDKEQANNPEYKPWYLPVAFNPAGDPSTAPLAEKLSLTLGNKPVIHVAQNPGCCLWLEVTHWQPYPSDPGYIILIQQGGGFVLASNAEQMQLAVDRIGHAYKPDQLPQGVMTNYRSIGGP